MPYTLADLPYTMEPSLFYAGIAAIVCMIFLRVRVIGPWLYVIGLLAWLPFSIACSQCNYACGSWLLIAFFLGGPFFMAWLSVKLFGGFPDDNDKKEQKVE